MPYLPPGELFPTLKRLKLRVSMGTDQTPAATEQGPPDFIKTLNNVRYDYVGPDTGIGGAFAHGVKAGVMAPLAIVGVKPKADETISGYAEKTSEFLGEMVGLGIGFIPFSVGAGVVLNGIGLTAAKAPILFPYLRNVLAGTTQFAGMSETAEDVPGNIAMGAAFGSAIELFFLRSAVKNRAALGAAGKKLTPDGSPIPEVPVRPGVVRTENAITPTIGQPVSMVQEVAAGLQAELPYDRVAANLARTQQKLIYLTNLKAPEQLMGDVLKELPTAQVVIRKTFGEYRPPSPRGVRIPESEGTVYDMLIHNPLTEGERLSPQQLSDWQKLGFFEGEEATFRGRTLRVGDLSARGEGYIPLEVPGTSKQFAVRASEVQFSQFPAIIPPNDVPSTLRQEIQTALATKKVGFTTMTADGGIMRGNVDTSTFAEGKSLLSYFKENEQEILSTTIRGANEEDTAKQFLLSRGVKGFIYRDKGVTHRIEPWDQGTVSFINKFDFVPAELDASTIVFSQGRPVVESFVPGWKNAIAGPMRESGMKEKEIQAFLKEYQATNGRVIEELIDDPSFQKMINSVRAQTAEGCL